MRTFSEFEKKIITEIVKIDPKNANVLTFITNSILQDRGIKIDEANKSISLWHLNTDKDAVSEFFETVALINYLEKSDLIFLHSNSEQTVGTKNFASKNIDQNYLDTKKVNLVDQPIPTNIYEHVKRYTGSYIFVGTELNILVKNNFVTLDEKRHVREIKIARWSLIIAFIALLFSFLSPFLFDTKIEQKQIDSIRTDLLRINSSVDSLSVQVEMKLHNESTQKQKINIDEKTINTSH
ncbi:hypothetical protein ACMDB5_10420 [Flavobacterium sp. W1B]|uniref:hypothetical protein n=1 Tax=Flavobacterium sp. W1B TaxID=3394146 RepID=UPI0039BC9B71